MLHLLLLVTFATVNRATGEPIDLGCLTTTNGAKYRNSCYTVYYNNDWGFQVSQPNAVAQCQSIRGHLAIIPDNGTQVWIMDRMKKLINGGSGPSYNTFFWIGATFQNLPDWTWLNGRGKQLLYRLWALKWTDGQGKQLLYRLWELKWTD